MKILATACACVLLAFGCGPSLDRSKLPLVGHLVPLIKVGQTKEEVDKIVGAPTHYGELWQGPPERPQYSGTHVGYWDAQDKFLSMTFTEDGKVLTVNSLPPVPLPPGQYRGFGLIKDKAWK